MRVVRIASYAPGCFAVANTDSTKGKSAATVTFGFGLVLATNRTRWPISSHAAVSSVTPFATQAVVGISTNTTFAAAFTALEKVDVPHVVVAASEDGTGTDAFTISSVLTQLDAHCAKMSGIAGKKERTGYGALAGSKSTVIAKAQAAVANAGLADAETIDGANASAVSLAALRAGWRSKVTAVVVPSGSPAALVAAAGAYAANRGWPLVMLAGPQPALKPLPSSSASGSSASPGPSSPSSPVFRSSTWGISFTASSRHGTVTGPVPWCSGALC